jgi:hypothetical protein
MSKRKQYKGVKYITDVIRRYGSKKRFATYKSAQEEARVILSTINKQNEKLSTNKEKSITVKRIMSFVRKKREGDLLPLPEEMTDINDYFTLVQYPDYILTQVDKRIKIISKVSPEGLPPIQGGTEPDFFVYFTDFVNYCNKLATLLANKEGKPYASGTDFFVRTTQPNADRICYIIPCDGDGDLYKFGFDSKNPEKDPEGLITSGKPKQKEEEQQPEPEKPVIESDEKEKSERVKQIRKLISELRKDVKEGLITKEFYQEQIQILTLKLEKGGKI